MGRKSTIAEIEQQLGKPISLYLAEAIRDGKKPPEIATELGIGTSRIYELIKEANLLGKLKHAAKRRPQDIGELKSALDDFLKDKETGGRSPKTLSNYRETLTSFLWWLGENGKPGTITAFSKENLRDFLYYIKTTPVRFGGKSTASRRLMKANTVNAYWRILRVFGYWLEREELIEKNPVKRLDQPKREKRQPEDLPNEILAKVLESFDDSFTGIRNKTIIMMFLDTGMRLDELVNLDVDQFDLDTRWANIIGKGNKERKICLSPDMLEQLRRYLKVAAPLAKTDKLWIIVDGTPFRRDSLRQMVKGLNIFDPEQRIHPHVFRHIWAKFMAQAHIDTMALKIMGGWEDMRLVSQYAAAYSVEEAWAAHAKASPLTILEGELNDQKSS